MTHGIHHITAIASDVRRTVDFYTKILGLRLVKKTVNQDDTQTYHLFFGDRLGHPGMDLTFFIFQPAVQGIRGIGQVTRISLSVPVSALIFWQKRFEVLKIPHVKIATRLDYKRLVFFDPDQLQIELVGVDDRDSDPVADVWTTNDIYANNAIKHFHSATLSVPDLTTNHPILTQVFGYNHEKSEGQHHLFSLNNSLRAHLLEVREEPTATFGRNAAGTVHHIAFRAKDADEQAVMRDLVLSLGLHPTEVIDRFYFKSVYFRTPAGILFEIATDGPGFTADEKEADLGKKLALPPFLEGQRKEIEKQLPIIN